MFVCAFSQNEDNKGEPVANAGFIAYEQGHEAVEPGDVVFEHDASAMKSVVKKRVVVGPLIGGTSATNSISFFDAARGACLASLIDIESIILI